jgi:DNA-directed RNA polymerase subunit RPC12/RpoP
VSSNVKLIAAGGILVLAIVIYMVRSGGNESPTASREYNTLLRCQECGAEFKSEVTIGRDIPPFSCEKCGKKAAWELWVCNDCGETFLPSVSGDPPRQEPMPRCPKCNSHSTGAAPVPD